MTDTEIRVYDQSTGEYVRTIERSVNSIDVNMQGVVNFRAGIQNWITFYAQHLGNDTITLPYSAKSDESQATSTIQSQVMTRIPMPYDLDGVVESIEKSTQSTGDYSSVINGMRFFLDEKLLETIRLDGSVKFSAVLAVKSDNTSGTAYLQRVTFNLRKLTGDDTYTTLGTKSINLSVSTTKTNYEQISVCGITDLSGQTLATDEKLLFEINTYGKISDATYTCTHKLVYNVEYPNTWVAIASEED